MNSIGSLARSGLPGLFALALAACGGGGGGDTDQGAGGPPPAPPVGGTSVVAGGWAGTASAGETAQAFVVADGTAWVFVKNGVQAPMDMFAGALLASGGQLSSTGMRAFDYETRGAADATVAGSYAVGSTMTMTVTPAGGVTVPVTLTAVPSTDYDPARAAVMADIAGPWGGAFRSEETGVVAIGNDGTIQNFTTSAGCSGFGSVTPRANENVFDVSLTLGPAPCAAPNSVATGQAFVVGSGASAKLYIGVKTPTGAQAASFIGARP